jgi:NADH:ubiquinone oxidoreductase subunit C
MPKWVLFLLIYQFISVVSAVIQRVHIRRLESHIVSGCKILKILLLILNRTSLFQFQQFLDLAIYDQPGKYRRFTLLYNILSIGFGSRLILHIKTNELISVDYVSKLYPSAG